METKKFKVRVKVVKCSKNTYWYRNEIGKEFDVFDIRGEDYNLCKNHLNFLLKSDCEVLPTRIEKPSLEFLLSLKHGQKCKVNISGDEVESIVNSIEESEDGNKCIFFCQNELNGVSCKNKMGKKYSWIVETNNELENIHWIELLDEPSESVNPICEPVIEAIDLTNVTMLFEETITFTEDEQFDIQLIDEMLNHLIK